MSGALLKKELRANGPLAAIFLGVVTLYGSMITSMFDPKLGDSLNIMMESMPELFAAFGMSNLGASLTQFLANYLYGFLLIALPLVMILLLVQRLLIRYTDRGAMAWLLASPTPRWKLVLTQAFVLVAAVVLLVGYMTGLCSVLAEVLFPGELELNRFALVNLGDLGLLLFFAGLCFCSACLFQSSGLALWVGGGLSVAFLLLDMLAGVGEQAEFLRWFTPVTLYDPVALANGENVLPLVGLYLGAVVLFAAGMVVFTRRDICV